MKSTSRWLRIAGMTVVVVAMAAALGADGGSQRRDDDGRDRDDRDDRTYAIGAWGDLPYSDIQAQVGVPNLIADMNRQDLEFTAARRRSQGGQQHARLRDAHGLQRRAVHAGPSLLHAAQGPGRVHPR